MSKIKQYQRPKYGIGQLVIFHFFNKDGEETHRQGEVVGATFYPKSEGWFYIINEGERSETLGRKTHRIVEDSVMHLGDPHL